jgi:serine/threonine protein phosphatase PrpC
MTAIAGLTDPGNRPGENQDSIGWDAARSIALVADGLGGHASGQVASGIVKQTVLELVDSLALDAAVMRAHAAVAEAAANDEHNRGMASTIVAIQIARGIGRIVWVGDSRAYLWRAGQLTQLTQDHSVVEQLRAELQLSETQVRSHPQRNQVTRVLGAGEPEADGHELPMHTHDQVLLCSDGLSGELRDAEIAGILGDASSLEDAVAQLIAAALAKGGHDNVSAVLVEYDGPTKRSFKLSSTALSWLAVLSGILLAGLLAGVLIWIYGKK